MKRLWGIIGYLFLLAALVSCGKPEEQPASNRKLAAIDSLMWQHPDSAFALLLEFNDSPEADRLDGFNRNYFHLLLSELLYKNDHSQSNRRELLSAVSYFDSLVTDNTRVLPRDAFLDARSHYINGVGYYEQDSLVEACKEYLKAIEEMEIHFEEEKLLAHHAKFLALAYTHLSGLFADQYLHEQAIFFDRRSLAYYKKYQETPEVVAWVLDEIGSHHDMMERLDSADYYYKQALDMVTDTALMIYRDISAHSSFLNYKMTKDAESSLRQLSKLLVLATNEDEYLSRCFTTGEVYYHEKQVDSAIRYLDEVFRRSNYIEARMTAATWLVELYKTKNDINRIEECASFLTQFNNFKDTQGESNTLFTDLYSNYQANQQQNNHEVNHNKLWYFVTAFLLLLIGTVLYSTLQKRNQFLHSANHDLSERLSIFEKKPSASTPKKKDIEQYFRLLNEPVCVKIRQKIDNKDILTTNKTSTYSDLAIDSKTKIQVKNTIEQYCNGFQQVIITAYPKLNSRDVDFCRYILLGLKPKEIAVLMQLDYSTTNRRWGKIASIMNTNDPQLAIQNMFFESDGTSYTDKVVEQ